MVTVRPEHQQKVIDALRSIDAIIDLPGLRSLRVHRSLDGEKLLSEMRWASAEAFQQAGQHPQVSSAVAEMELWVESRQAGIFTLLHDQS